MKKEKPAGKQKLTAQPDDSDSPPAEPSKPKYRVEILIPGDPGYEEARAQVPPGARKNR